MAKFLILFNSPQKSSEQMAQATPEQMQASMQEWTDWKEMAEKSVGFEWGMPLEVVSRVTPTGTTTSDTQASGYLILEGDSKEEIVRLVSSHPHLKRAGATADILEMLSMPGM